MAPPRGRLARPNVLTASDVITIALRHPHLGPPKLSGLKSNTFSPVELRIALNCATRASQRGAEPRPAPPLKIGHCVLTPRATYWRVLVLTRRERLASEGHVTESVRPRLGVG